jgi:hypothetical protein
MEVLPVRLPEMELLYSQHSTARATLSTVISMTKWLGVRVLTLEVLLQHQAHRTASAAAAAAAAAEGVRQAVPGPMGVELAAYLTAPDTLWDAALDAALFLAHFALHSLVWAAALLDPGLPQGSGIAAAAAGRARRAWWVEKILLDRQPDNVREKGDPTPAAYMAELSAHPQRSAGIRDQLQQGVQAQAAPAAARQATKLTQRLGGDVSALMEQLNAIQLGGSSSSSVSSGTSSSMAAGVNRLTGETVPPVTPGDITVAANALLVACKAAGVPQGLPQLLEQVYMAMVALRWATPSDSSFGSSVSKINELHSAVRQLVEWAALLGPVLMQLLPAEQVEVLTSRLSCLIPPVDSSSSSSNGAAAQGASTSGPILSAEDVDTVLGTMLDALHQMVVPGQPGCSNPRCCCLDGVSEAEMKTQVCAGCRGARCCSAACQRRHWRAGHKEVCKAVQAAAAAAAAADTS